MRVCKDRRFVPLFVTQFFGAFNDNFLKNALVLLIVLNPEIVGGEQRSDIYINVLSAVFIAPYFLFSIISGQLSDKYPRDRIARLTKVWELLLMALAGMAFYIHSPWPMAIILFMMGMQSTFFSPAKYAILPQLLNEKELVNANAILEAGTYLAIIGGTLCGSTLIKGAFGKELVWGLLFLFAIVGYLTSRGIPKLAPVEPDLKLNFNPVRGGWELISEAYALPEVFFAIIAGSWFWVVGVILLAQIPSLCRNVLHIESAVPLLLMTFTLGIGIGTFLASRLMRGIVQTTPVPFAMMLMIACLVPLAGYCESFSEMYAGPGTIKELFTAPLGRRILLCLLGASTACGIFIVPLNTLIQYASPKNQVARMIAANNIVNALAMTAASLSVVVLLNCGQTITQVIRFTGFAAVAVLAALLIKRPADVIRGTMQIILALLYRVKINGHHHYETLDKRALLIANHVSLLDGVLLAAFLPGRLGFAMAPEWEAKWYINLVRPVVNVFPIDPHGASALRAMIAQVDAGPPCVIFPEGRITTDGTMSPIQPGAAFISQRAKAAVLPVAITGARETFFAYRTTGRKLFPTIELEIFPEIPYNGETRDERQEQIVNAMTAIQAYVENDNKTKGR